MKLFGSKRREQVDPSREAPPRAAARERREVVVGAGVVGAVALAAQVLPSRAVAPAAASASEASATAAGYRLTDHVKRYYETTKA